MSEPVRVLRVIARLNMGGPAHHVALLSALLDPDRYQTLLLHGDVGEGEASLAGVADRLGVERKLVRGLGPALRPFDDLRSLITLTRAVRTFRPDLVHTHTAKAGLLGRLAAILGGRPRPVIVHTFHGHVLEGYFGRVQTGFYRLLERLLGRASDALIGVSSATVDDLVRLGVGPRSKFRVIPIGLDLARFTEPPNGARARFRAEVGASDDDVVVTFVGRLVPIKRVDLALQSFAHARSQGAPVRLAIVGDGQLRDELEAIARNLAVADAAIFLGYREDMVEVTAGADIALLTSANEGTPVSLIEAGAAGRPAVSTGVGGVADVVTSETGIVVAPGDDRALGAAISELATDGERRQAMGTRAREHVLGRFSVTRLVADVDALYGELLRSRRR
jgi:glycosyltransferase involved in cell wall biosynthesis